MATPLVSIVIPAYNPGRFLRDALESLLEQSLDSWEAHVIDDGSTEDLSYANSMDPRIKVIRQDNRGLSAARNAGIERSIGEYVAFLDADDVWYSAKLERQLQLMAATPSMLASSTAFDIVDAEGVRLGPGFGGYHTSYLELLQGNGICVSTVMAQRGAVVQAGQFERGYQQAQDWALWLEMSKRQPFGYLAEPAAGYRLYGGNMSGNYRRLLKEGTTILEAHRRSASDPTEAAAAQVGKRRLRLLCGAQAYDVFRESRRFSALLDALWLAPRYTARSLVRFVASKPARAR